MVEIIIASPEPVTVISIAVASNVARALEIEPRIAAKCRFVGMHGSVHVGYNGQPGAVAESNVRYDVPALRKVFAVTWLKKNITPLDTCGVVLLDGRATSRSIARKTPSRRRSLRFTKFGQS